MRLCSRSGSCFPEVCRKFRLKKERFFGYLRMAAGQAKLFYEKALSIPALPVPVLRLLLAGCAGQYRLRRGLRRMAGIRILGEGRGHCFAAECCRRRLRSISIAQKGGKMYGLVCARILDYSCCDAAQRLSACRKMINLAAIANALSALLKGALLALSCLVLMTQRNNKTAGGMPVCPCGNFMTLDLPGRFDSFFWRTKCGGSVRYRRRQHRTPDISLQANSDTPWRPTPRRAVLGSGRACGTGC